MIQIDTLVVGAYQANCYILHKNGSARCVVIDPGDEPGRILAFLGENGLSLEAILLTHGHFDHVGGVKDLASETNCSVYIRSEETTMPPQMTAGPLYFTQEYPDQFHIADMDFSVLHTPGHTPGSVCLCVEDAMFSGDTLFASSCGRTDLPGGDWSTLVSSLHLLRDLPGDYRVFPGHAEATTLANERRYNLYLR